jgi:chorismate dehydratase
MNELRIGQIDYLNCLPIFSEFADRHGEDAITVRGVPSALNRMLASGEIDICPSSSIEYAKGGDYYSLFPGLSISSIGPVMSVLLFTRGPIEALDGLDIGLTVDSDTSVALLTILLRRRFGLRNTFRRLDIHSLADADLDAVLLIGDKALREEGRADGWLVHDLGQLWWEFSGLPFVFALWIVRREACIRYPEEMRRLAGWFHEAKESAYLSYERIARGVRGSDLSAAELVNYWKTISYDLSPRHVKGVQLFFRLAEEEGIISSQPEISFFPPA